MQYLKKEDEKEQTDNNSHKDSLDYPTKNFSKYEKTFSEMPRSRRHPCLYYCMYFVMRFYKKKYRNDL